jgi:hypothetical protein
MSGADLNLPCGLREKSRPRRINFIIHSGVSGKLCAFVNRLLSAAEAAGYGFYQAEVTTFVVYAIPSRLKWTPPQSKLPDQL